MIKRIYSTCALIALLFLTNTVLAQDSPEVTIGGALRFNYNLSSWKEGQQDRGGDFGYDVFRLNGKAKYKGLTLNAEYRFYSESFGGGMLKQGWIGYEFTPEKSIQLGLTQVPFGITTYNSNNWFFSINYYVGLEDDHDMGVKYTYEKNNWVVDLAFFKNAEELQFGSESDTDAGRYSYDVGSIGLDSLMYRNKEVNQVNAKIAYNLGNGNVQHQLGVSGEFGGLYNLDTHKTGNHLAAAAHYQLKAGNFKFQAAGTYYKYNPKHPEGQDDRQIAMVAYGASYLVASEAFNLTANVAYNVPVDWDPISSLTFYNDFGWMNKMESSFEDTYMNVTGVLITAGNIYTYVDYAMGKNQPWLGPDWTNGLAAGNPDADWDSRFNINIGYYF